MKALTVLVLFAVLILFIGCLDSFLAVRRTGKTIPPLPIPNRKERFREDV